MPIEIKELHIRVAVNNAQNGQSAKNQAANGGDSGQQAGSDSQEMLIAECVEQVLQILQNRMER